jgi:type IV pilus assembly protein PilQ
LRYTKIILGSFLIFFLYSKAYAQPYPQADSTHVAKTDTASVPQALVHLKGIVDSTQFDVDLNNLPTSALKKVGSLNFRDLDIRDLLRGIGKGYDVNLIVDNNIKKKATIRLSDIPVIEALIYICQENNLKLIQTGHVFRVRNYNPPKKEPKPDIPDITVASDGMLTFDLDGDQLKIVMRTLSEKTGKNIVIRNGVTGSLSGFLQNVSFELGLKTLLSNNGFTMREKDGIYEIDRAGMFSSAKKGKKQAFWVNVDDSLVSIDVVNAPLTNLIREIGYQMNINLITYQLPKGTITAKLNKLTLEDTFEYLFRGTNFTYRKEDGIYIIGDKKISGIATTKLIRLKHIRADVVMKMIPNNIKQAASIEVVKEQNGLMVIGTNDVIFELENFIDEIDHPTPQIMIEAMVIDVNTSDLFQLGVTLAKGAAPDSSFLNPFAIFGARDRSGRQSGGLVATGNGNTANKWFGSGGNLFGIKNLGTLPADFFFRIQALSQKGVVDVRSRPQISTLNGHKASIEIGTTQYFILKSTTPLQSPNQIVTQESERFEKIEANVSLEITPWVSSSGEVTTEIHPEFNTPVGNFNSQVPPTINSRVLDSTVRLKDGETIILGGLIRDKKTVQHNKIPILGDIPLLGQLFRNRSTDKSKSELVIFITPHVFFGDGNDARRWRELKNDLDVDYQN